MADAGLRLQLGSRNDLGVAARIFATAGRVHVPAILRHEGAVALHNWLASECPWRLHYTRGEQHFDLLAEDVAAMSTQALTDLRRMTMAEARVRFACIYRSYRDSDIPADPAHAGSAFAEACRFISSAEFLAFARAITGIQSITHIDAQATCYDVGDFLTTHTDDVAGKHRVAAYVLNFTPQWNVDWGGILQFVARDGHVMEGYTPTFNALNVFRVPQLHSVSMVAPFSPRARYSITGWFRTAGD